MNISEQWAAEVWPQVIANTGIASTRTQLIVVRSVQPNGAAECAYCPPSFGKPLDSPGVYQVIRGIGDRAFERHHVVAVWEELPTQDELSAAALLRHEIEHARQWEHWGPWVMDELDAELKAVLADKDDGAYHRAPSERGADDAARYWAGTTHGWAVADRLADEFFPHWREVPDGARETDLRTATVAALRADAPAGYQVEMPGGGRFTVDEFVEAQSEWNGLHGNDRDADSPEIEFVG